MIRVLKVSNTDKKGKTSVITVNKTVEELNNSELNWVAKSLRDLKAPNGNKLTQCAWHSGSCHTKGDIDNPSLCYIDPVPTYGLWLTNYIVYDTCHLKETQEKVDRVKEIKRMDEHLNNLGSFFELCNNLHDPFKSNLSKRNECISKVKILEKSINDSINVNDAEYIQLQEMVKIQEDVYNTSVKNLTQTYNATKNRSISLDLFLDKYTVEERAKIQKAKDAMVNWYNAHSKSDKSNLIDSYYENNKLLKDLNHTLKTSFTIPFAHIYRLYLNLRDVEKVMFRYKMKRSYTPENLKYDINWCKINIDLYNEFLQNRDPMSFVAKVERDKQISEIEDRKFNSVKSVEKVQNRKVMLMDDDGNLREVDVDYKVFTGYTNDTGGWRDSAEPLDTRRDFRPTVDDSKWGKLR